MASRSFTGVLLAPLVLAGVASAQDPLVTPEVAPSHPSCEGSSDPACASVPHEPLPEPPPPPSLGCEGGDASACAELANAKLQAKDAAAAEDAWLRACSLGHLGSCATLGKRRLERNDFDGAEPLLQKAGDAGDADAARALLSLHERRDRPGDADSAAELRAAAAALEKPDVEGVFLWRFGPAGSSSAGFALNIQPMAFWNRRINAGFYLAGGSTPFELDGFLGAQSFVNEYVAGYVRVLVGTIPDASPNQGLNYGAELGAKLCLGEVGHVEASIGSSRASPMHVSLGLGLNGLILLALLLH